MGTHTNRVARPAKLQATRSLLKRRRSRPAESVARDRPPDARARLSCVMPRTITAVPDASIRSPIRNDPLSSLALSGSGMFLTARTMFILDILKVTK